MCVACDNGGVVWVFDLFSCCDDDNYVVTMLLVSVTICPDHVCALHHPGLHPSSLWPAGPYQKYSPWQSFYSHSWGIINPFTELDQSQGWLFTPGHTISFPFVPNNEIWFSVAPAIDKKPSYSPPGHWEACPSGVTAWDNFTENSIPGWKWLIVFKTELKGGGKLETPVTFYQVRDEFHSMCLGHRISRVVVTCSLISF